MLDLAQVLRDRGAGVRLLGLRGGDVDTSTPMGSMSFTIMTALAQMEHDIKRERIVDSINKRHEDRKGQGGRPRRVTDSQRRSAVHLVRSSEPAAKLTAISACRAQRSMDGTGPRRVVREASTKAPRATEAYLAINRILNACDDVERVAAVLLAR